MFSFGRPPGGGYLAAVADIDDPELACVVAASMDADPELLPVLPSLLSDLEDLGACAADVVAILRDAELPPGARGLDLGCGKGAAALAVAETFGTSMLGIDAIPAFVEHARARAYARQLARRCVFEVGDVRGPVSRATDFDLAMLLALGDVLGDDPSTTVLALRRWVRPGGYMLIDDAFVADGVDLDDEDLVGCHDHATTVAALQAHGDVIVSERIIDDPDKKGFYTEMTARIAERCRVLAPQFPDLSEAIREYAERQQHEVALLEGPVVGALWLLRRGPSPS